MPKKGADLIGILCEDWSVATTSTRNGITLWRTTIKVPSSSKDGKYHNKTATVKIQTQMQGLKGQKGTTVEISGLFAVQRSGIPYVFAKDVCTPKPNHSKSNCVVVTGKFDPNDCSKFIMDDKMQREFKVELPERLNPLNYAAKGTVVQITGIFLPSNAIYVESVKIPA